MQEYNLTLLGLEVVFRASVDPQRIAKAKKLVEDRFTKLKSHGDQNSKELLLTFLVLGLADDLLQSNKQLTDVQERIDALLTKIEDLA